MGDAIVEASKLQGKANAIDMSVEEPFIFEPVVIINNKKKSETETIPTCRSENGSTLTSKHAAQEANHEKIVSASSVTSTHEDFCDEIHPLQKGVEEHKMAEIYSSNCESWADWKDAEAGTACELSDPEDSVHFKDSATAATLRDATAGVVGEMTELHRGFTEVPNGFEYGGQLTNFSEENFISALKMVPVGSNTRLDTSSHCLTADNTSHSLDVKETVSLKAIEGLEYLFDQATGALGTHTSMTTCDTLNFVDFSEHQLPIEEIRTATVVSTDLNGWQHFDAEESQISSVGFPQTIDGASQNQLELWEQLLEDGLEDSAQPASMTTAPVETDVGMDFSTHDENRFWSPSPGNPFIEGLARSSNFSETEGFVTNVNIVGCQSHHDYRVDPSFDKGPIQSDDIGKQIYPGISSDKLVKKNMGIHFDEMHIDGSKKVAQQRFPSFSDLRRSSSRPRDSSFPSFQEQEPAYIAHGYEPGGEKWEANFDVVASATTGEVPRSLSLPREAGDSQFLARSCEAPVTSQSKLSSFLSPKLSPLVKKGASKVCTDQVEKGSKVAGKKSSKKWTWRCCICCSDGS